MEIAREERLADQHRCKRNDAGKKHFLTPTQLEAIIELPPLYRVCKIPRPKRVSAFSHLFWEHGCLRSYDRLQHPFRWRQYLPRWHSKPKRLLGTYHDRYCYRNPHSPYRRRDILQARLRSFVSFERISHFPAGLRMIGGTRGKGQFAFTCYGGSVSTGDSSRIPVCPSDTTMLEMAVMFPQCWDGANLTSVDQSHMSDKVDSPQGGVCPSSHPVPLTHITLKVKYDIRSGYANWRLSSDDIDPSRPAGASAHGDWFNGWDPEISDAWGNNCVRARADCHGDLLGDGRQLRQDYPAYQATGQ